MPRIARLAALAAALGGIVAACSPGWAGEPLTGSGRNIRRHTVSSGGMLLADAGSTLRLESYVGEPAVSFSSMTGTDRVVPSGLAHMAAQPGTVTSITAVTKDTDTLTLRWVSPGVDGFQGNVTNGFYRIDYSSDSAHLFSPTTFQVELATSVVASSTQTYQLSGLLPNTTYYTKVYLAEDRKYFSEDSVRSDEATYAKVVINPVFSGVFSSSVTISWTLPTIPSGGSAAAGYDDQASTSSFAGGAVFSSATANGTVLTLTVSGLSPATTYFFRVGSLNRQSEKNFTALISTRTLDGIPLVTGLSARADDGGEERGTKSVTLTWSNPDFAQRVGVLVLRSTNSATSQVVNGTDFAVGQVLGDASVVKAIADAQTAADSGEQGQPLLLNTTYYYHVFTEGLANTYSVGVSTFVYMDLPPMEVAGLGGAGLISGGAQFAMAWSTVTRNMNGDAFFVPGAPTADELRHYRIDVSSRIAPAGFVQVTTLPVTASSYTADISTPGDAYLYRVVAVDAYGKTGPSMAVHTLTGDLYSFATDDNFSYMRVGASVKGQLLLGGNSLASDLVMRMNPRPQDLSADSSGKTLRSLDFALRKAATGQRASTFQFSRPDAEVVVHYPVSGGQVTPLVANSADQLGVFWDNGSKFVKLFGSVNTSAQTVTVQTAMPGTYQLRNLFRTGAFEFNVSGLSNKALTPNGDGLNDKVVFTFDNPRFSDVTGSIFDLSGAKISDMAAGPLPNTTLQWDGRGSGRVVPGGVYIYQIRAEEKVFNGTVVVIR